MANTLLTEKLVYLTLKDIFSGNEIYSSKVKKISKKIEKYQEDAKIGILIREHGIEKVSVMAKVLLDEQVFASRARAKVRFPDLFESHSSQNNQPSTSEPKFETSNTATAQRVEVYSPEELLGIGDRLKLRKEKEKAANTDSQSQSLDRVSLPLWDQHRLLVKIQYTLEKACFTFAQRKLAGLLQREEWDCAEAVELNRWATILLVYREELCLDDVKDIGKPLPTLLDWITQLRHDAVHRVHLSSSSLLQRMTAAGLLARLLQDDDCKEFISNIRQKTQDAIEELLRNKQSLDDKMAKIKEAFAAKRAELERQESALLEAAVKEHKEPVISVSGSLDRLSVAFGATDAIHAPWKHECDPALADNGSSGYEGIVDTHVITHAPEAATETAVTKVRNAIDEEDEKAKEARKKANEEKTAKEQAKQQEEADRKATEDEEGINEPKVEGELGGGAVEDVHEDVEIVKQLPVPHVLVPTVDSGPTELALTGEKEGAEKDKDEDSSEVERYFECPEVVLDDYESDPKHPSIDLPLNQQVVETDTTNSSNGGEKKSEIAAASESADSDLLEYDERSLNEWGTSPDPTCVGKIGNNTDQGHTKSYVGEDTPVGNGIMDPEARQEQPAAPEGQSCPLKVNHPCQEDSWPGSVCIKGLDDDPRLKLLSVANGNGGVTLVRMQGEVCSGI